MVVSDLTNAIQGHLQTVEAERKRRSLSPQLAQQVEEVKRYQHDRFSATYRDLLQGPASGKAASFFLQELYGPMDFSNRDAQFSRVAPKIASLFPGEIGRIVLCLARLHALSEQLDSAMGAVVTSMPLSAAAYRLAWQTVGQADLRSQQIGLLQEVGMSLAKQVRKPLIGATLRLMRRPAKAAGLDSLQAILESGFDAFRELPDAAEFVQTIVSRERHIAAVLFANNN